MITDQARNLRILAEQKGVTGKQSLPHPKIVPLKSTIFFVAGTLVIILFLYFEYLNQRHMLEVMSEKNTAMEERIIFLGAQLENLMQWREREKHLNLVEKEIDTIQREMNTLKSQQEEIHTSFSHTLALSLDSLGEKAKDIISSVGQMKAETEEVLNFLGVVISYDSNYKLVVVSHIEGIEFEEGGYVAVHGGEQRVAILRVIEVRENVSACEVVELWAPIYKGDRVRRL